MEEPLAARLTSTLLELDPSVPTYFKLLGTSRATREAALSAPLDSMNLKVHKVLPSKQRQWWL